MYNLWSLKVKGLIVGQCSLTLSSLCLSRSWLSSWSLIAAWFLNFCCSWFSLTWTSLISIRWRLIATCTLHSPNNSLLRGVYSDTTQLNSTDPVEQRTAKSVASLFMTSWPTNWVNCCSRCRVEFSWVELCRYKYPFTASTYNIRNRQSFCF